MSVVQFAVTCGFMTLPLGLRVSDKNNLANCSIKLEWSGILGLFYAKFVYETDPLVYILK